LTHNDDFSGGTEKNIPIAPNKNIPLALLGKCHDAIGNEKRNRRRYSRVTDIETLAVDKYKKNGKGITFRDLLSARLALHKEQAQTTLKHCLKRGILFTLENCKPQQYYPQLVKPAVLKMYSEKNIPVDATGVNLQRDALSPNVSSSKYPLSNAIANKKALSLLETLCLLPYAPPFIHKLQLILSIDRRFYNELAQSEGSRNRAKLHEENIGRRHVTYTLSPSGTIEVAIATSDTPFKLETDDDEIILFAFFGQVRDRLVYLLKDVWERNVPPILEWVLKACDLNKDIHLDDKAQLVLPDIQLRNAGRVFRLYVKVLNNKAVCRTEESLSLSLPLVEALDNIRHPYKSIEEKIDSILNRVDNQFEQINARLLRPNPTETSSSDIKQQRTPFQARRFGD
jgi:hypothetical protein